MFRDKPVLGPLTSTIVDRSRDQFPSSQEWADEVEKILSFAETRGQFERHRKELRHPEKRISVLAELRTAFYFQRNSFPVVEWEPPGEAWTTGEYLVQCPSGSRVFVEVKSPGWEGELSEEEIKAGRAEDVKYINGEGSGIARWERIQFIVGKAYQKFTADKPNLLVLARGIFILFLTKDAFIAANLLDSAGPAFFGQSKRVVKSGMK